MFRFSFIFPLLLLQWSSVVVAQSSENGSVEGQPQVSGHERVAQWLQDVESTLAKVSALAACGQAGFSMCAARYGEMAAELQPSPTAEGLAHVVHEIQAFKHFVAGDAKVAQEIYDLLKDGCGLGSDGVGGLTLLVGAIPAYLSGQKTYVHGTGLERLAGVIAAGLGGYSHWQSDRALIASQKAGAAEKQGLVDVQKNYLAQATGYNRSKNKWGAAATWGVGAVLFVCQSGGVQAYNGAARAVKKWWNGSDHEDLRIRIRPYNDATRAEAVRRNLGWGAWGCASASNVCSWIVDEHEDTDSGVVFARDGLALASSVIQLLMAHESPVNFILAMDNSRIGMGIYEDPGSKLVRCLPKDSQVQSWVSDLRDAYWQDGQSEVQAEYLSLPGKRGHIVGLELRHPEQAASRVLLVFGRVGNPDDAGQVGFEPQALNPWKSQAAWTTLAGVVGMPWNTLPGGDTVATTMAGGTVPRGASRMHRHVSDCLGLEARDCPYDPITHRGAQVRVEGSQVLYQSDLSGQAEGTQRVDMMVIFTGNVPE